MRKLFALLIAVSTLFLGNFPALGLGDLTVTAPTSIQYDPAVNGFSVTGISISNPPAYLQVGLTIVDTAGNQVPFTDPYRVAVGNQCSKDADWTNSDTGGVVTVSGDNTTNVILSGTAENITAILDHVWIYETASTFCDTQTGKSFAQSLLNRKLQITAIESQAGLIWSPSTHHYYQLATQTTDDGMGQPTDDNGNITDSSRYFVRWSTARAEAKAANINFGGQTHRGYLAAITTKDEFSFLNDNVTGGSGTLYPAWVGGSDAGTEGIWNWVDGPEAAQFGGDSLNIINQTDPENRPLQNGGGLFIDFNGTHSWTGYGMLMRDQNGDVVKDPTTGYDLTVNLDQGMYCSQAFADINAAWQSFQDNGPEIDPTPFGSTVKCKMESYYGYPYLTAVVVDGNNKEYGYESDLIFHLRDDGNNLLDSSGNYLSVRPNTSDMIYNSTSDPNYAGANFWGPDSTNDPGDGTPDYCQNRGVRGVCNIGQYDIYGQWQSNDYYVYWSNGNGGYHSANWDGTGTKPGDGVYNPQPDNFGGDSPNGEDALIINWCARNPGAGDWSTATEETLYGNPGYYCTPGWNDLTAGDWGLASSVYTGPAWDTPNQIGTTDYVIEYCGYSDEASCATSPSAVASTSFSLASSSCPATGTPQLSVSYSAPGVDTTDLTSSTMATETFDNVPAGNGWLPDQMTNVGYLSGYTAAYPAGVLSGSGGVGNFIAAADTLLTLPTTECYIGFWWSAGNAANYVDLLDSSNNVLATFNASDLVNALGPCPNPYCGNPNIHDSNNNGGELYAYVHMRLPTGFQKVHFYGQGFELDTISTSVTVPVRASTETNLNGPVVMSLSTPDVIPVDPQATSITLPELQVAGDPGATLCFEQVADANGSPVDSQDLTVTPSGSDPVTSQNIGFDKVITGNTSDVITASGHVVVSRGVGAALAPNASVFLRVSASATQSPDSSTCGAGTIKVIEIRPIGLDFTDVFGIQVIEH